MEKGIIIQIIEIFKSKLDWTINYFKNENITSIDNHDGQLQINIGNKPIHLVYEVKKSIVPSSIPSIKSAIQKINLKKIEAQSTIVLANYISTKARQMLVENSINYADTAGNIFFKYKDVYVHIETGQSDRSAIDVGGGRAFTKSGLRVLYQYFRSEERLDLNGQSIDEIHTTINDPIRKLAKQAQVSKDTVSKVLQDLLEQGYILRKNKKEFKWKDKKSAFDKWVERVNEVLRPSLYYKTYRLMEGPINQQTKPHGYQLGGYYGAERWMNLPQKNQIVNAPYLIYTHKGFNDVITDLKVAPDPDGQVTVMEAFWQDDSNISPSADFPVLYADLLDANDPRMIEIAELIYNSYLYDKL